MAVRFDADTEDYTNTTGTYNIGTCTITCWVRIDVDRNAVSSAWCIDDGASIAILLQTLSDGVTWQMADTATGNSTLFAATVGVWYYIAAVKATGAGATVVYWAAADTLPLSSASSSHLESSTVSVLRIGASVNSGEWLNGSIAALKVWDGVNLTQAEIERERFQYLPHRTTNLIAFYPLLEGGNTVGAKQDFSGAGNVLSGGAGSVTTDGPPITWRQYKRQYPFVFSAAAPAFIPEPGGYILNEDGTKIMLEDGSGFLILEETVGDVHYPSGYGRSFQNTLIRL